MLERLLQSENLAAALYGTILVSSVLVALAKTRDEPGFMILVIVVTALVFAVAHAWTVALGHSAEEHRPLHLRTLAGAVRHEWPMVEAAFPASAALALAAAGLYSVGTGLWIAFGVNVGLLFLWAAALRHRAGGDFIHSVLSGLGGATFGLLLVVLKVIVH